MKALIALLVLVAANVAVFGKIELPQYFLGHVQLWDFDIYHQTARNGLAGANFYHLPYMQISGPPLVVIPFVPFAWLTLGVGRSIISSLSVVAGFATCWVLVHYFWPRISLVKKLMAVLIFNLMLWLAFPTRFNLITGQPNLILMFLTTVVLINGHIPTKGVAAGLMAVIKTNYLLILFSFWQSLKGSLALAVGVIVVGGLLSLWLFNPQSSVDFLTKRGPAFATTPVPTTDVDYYNQSLRATMARFHVSNWYSLVFLVVSVVGIGYVGKSGDAASGLLISLLLSPIVWQHYVVVVYPLLAIQGFRLWQRKEIHLWFVVATALLILHFPRLHGSPAEFPANVIGSHYFLGLGILLAYQVTQSRRGRIVA